MSTPYGQLIKLLMASGVRLREAAGARWSEFSSDFSEWLIPGSRMKEGQAHVVCLPPIVRQMLCGLPRHLNSDLVFTCDGKRPVTGFSNLKRQLDKALYKALAGAMAKQFTFHDYRRTITTWLVRTGTDSIVADRILAHTQLAKISAVASTYNIYDFEKERRVAIGRWVDFLAEEEAEVSANTSPQLALPAPDCELALSAPDRDLGVEYDSTFPLHAAYHADMMSPPIVKFLPSRQEERDGAAERLNQRVQSILADSNVMRAGLEIWKARLTPAFEAKHPDNSHSEAIKFMAHCAAQWAVGRETVRKRPEVEANQDGWAERGRDARHNADVERAAAEQARALRQEEYAQGHEAAARQYDAEADLCEEFLQAAMTIDDPCCVEYRSCDPSHPSARAKAVLRLLEEVTVTIFGRRHPTWAEAFASAATGTAVTRNQGRRRSAKQIAAPKRGALVG